VKRPKWSQGRIAGRKVEPDKDGAKSRIMKSNEGAKRE
jgi:hypothetical protein